MTIKGGKVYDFDERPEVNPRLRRCKLKSCNTKLSSYNLNDYCLAHTAAGSDEKWEETERKRRIAYKKQKRIMHNKSAERRKAKDEKPKRTYQRSKELQGAVS